MSLSTEDVVLREFRESDIRKKVEWINDINNNEFLHYDIPLDEEKTKTWFMEKNNDIRRDMVVEYKNEPIGLIGLLNIDRINLKAEFYICIGEKGVKRKGIATCVTRLLLKSAFRDLGLNKIYLNVDAENLAACCLYEKVGFVCEGHFKEELFFKGRLVDRKRYAILRRDYDGDCKRD